MPRSPFGIRYQALLEHTILIVRRHFQYLQSQKLHLVTPNQDIRTILLCKFALQLAYRRNRSFALRLSSLCCVS